jgi:hypothetical protein
MSFFSTLFDVGGGIAGSLAKVALLGYASRLLSKNTDVSSTGQADVVDPGVRLQLNPSTENQIPVLYGDVFLGGNITDAQLSNGYKRMTYCLTIAEITGEKLSTSGATSYTFKNVYFNNNRVVFKADGITVDYTLDSGGNQDISMRDLIKVYVYGGLVGLHPTGYAGTTPAPSTVMPGWTAGTHPMSGLLYAIVEVNYNKSKNVSGLPECVFNIESSMTLPGDVLVDYMVSTTYGAGIPAEEIDGTSFAALNTYCSTGFTYRTAAGTTTSGPITIGGLVDTGTTCLTNMEELAKAGSAWISYDIHTGTWVAITNKAGSPIVTLTDDNIVGEISISGTSLTQLNNIANVKYQNSDIYDKTDFVKITIPDEDLFQNEPRSSLELTLPFNNQQAVAMKLGLQLLKQARVDKIISFKTDFSYMNLRAGDIIGVTSSPYGFTNKAFRIITVEETEGDMGEIVLDFKALEYDATVYEYDIQEYFIETDDGILGIGSIGKPDTPVVTKTEQSNLPKIVITAEVPSGIVDTMEFWLTFDTGVLTDANRTYVQIGTYSNTTGATLTENQVVTYTYSGLSQSDFIVKVRGANSVTTGPYSDPTGMIAYVPIVVADTVSNEPVSIGGQLMSLGLLTLLNNLDKLFTGSSAAGGVFDKVFSTFKDVTGYDLIGSAGDGTLNVTYVPSDAPLCSLDFSGVKYPSDRSTSENPEQNTSGDRAASTGDYYFYVTPGSTGAALSKGAGAIKLYKSDGTLVQTVSGSSVTIDGYKVSIPFSTRTIGIDYYILMEKNVVNDGTCQSAEINNPITWNFHTADPQDEIPPVAPPPPTTTVTCPPVRFVGLTTYKSSSYVSATKPTSPYGVTISKDNTLVDIESNIGIKFNQAILLNGSGTVTIKKGSSTHQAFDLSFNFTNNKISELFWVQGDTLWLNSTVDFDKGATYYVTLSSNCVKNSCNTSGNTAFGDSSTTNFTIDPGPTTKSSQGTPVQLNYNRPVSVNGSSTITIKDSNNNIIKSIPGNSPSLSTKEG